MPLCRRMVVEGGHGGVGRPPVFASKHDYPGVLAHFLRPIRSPFTHEHELTLLVWRVFNSVTVLTTSNNAKLQITLFTYVI